MRMPSMRGINLNTSANSSGIARKTHGTQGFAPRQLCRSLAAPAIAGVLASVRVTRLDTLPCYFGFERGVCFGDQGWDIAVAVRHHRIHIVRNNLSERDKVDVPGVGGRLGPIGIGHDTPAGGGGYGSGIHPGVYRAANHRGGRKGSPPPPPLHPHFLPSFFY